MYNLNAAVAGTGFIGPVHVEALRRLGIGVTGVLGSTPEKSARAQQQMGLPRAYASFDEILEDPEVDAVHIAVPNRLHAPMARRALLAGKHVMCEKPLAMTAEETASLVALAQETNCVAGVCYNIRFYPLNLEVQDMVRRGDLGRIFSVVGRYVQDWLLYDTDYNWRVLQEQGGALRAIADIGTHWMDLITTITGLEVEAVMADLQTVHSVRQRPLGEIATFTGGDAAQEREPVPIATEDSGAVLFRFKGGARGVLWVSQVTAGRKNRLQYEIAGARHAVSWNSEAPNTLWKGHRDRPNEQLMRDPGLVSDHARTYINYPGGHAEGFPDTFKQCFRAFYDAIASGNSGPAQYPTFEQGHHEVVLCEAILESHRQGRWITL